jgi:hypothetical protein
LKLVLSNTSELLRNIREYREWFIDRTRELLNRLAEYGVRSAEISFESALYDGDNDVTVTWEERGDNIRAVIAKGNATLFIEFGSGATYGYGHPEPLSFGPGTWSDSPQGKGHWQDPDGWYYEHGKKSMGNPPSQSMYSARKLIAEDFEQIAKDVFKR